MPYTLVIAEKPSSAQKIAFALAENGVEKKAKNRVPYYELERTGEKIVVAPAAGHLYALQQASGGSDYPVFGVVWKPSFEVDESAAFTKAYLHVIESLAKRAGAFVAATDYDIEGEVIAANVLEFACKASNAKRMKFSTLTREDLLEAYEHMLPSLEHGMVEAGRTRHEMDFYWGISLSRALMHAIKSAGLFKVMSIGRVQGPALAILARREKEILGFKPVPYWLLLALVHEVEFKHVHGNFFDRREAEQALARSAKHGSVAKVERFEYRQMAPTPFDLTTLQTEAYRCFGFSPARTLEIAQRLYENVLASYPRTSSQKLPTQLNLPKIISKLGQQSAYSHLAAQLMQEKRFKPYEGKQSDPAHPAIHPTGEVPAKLSPEEHKLYDLIAKRFLACFAEPAVREKLNVEVMLGSELFKAQGVHTLQKNWMVFYEPYAEFDEVILPNFAEAQEVQAQKIWLQEKKTQPPNRFTEASLVRKLEANGLGTKATRAQIVQTLFDRGYVKGRSIQVTPFGMAVYESLAHSTPQILSEQLTREFEKEMELIQAGKKKSDEVLAHGRLVLTRLLDEFKPKEEAVGKELLVAFNEMQREQQTLGKCSACAAGMLVVRKGKYGSFVGCSSYPNCKNTFPLPKNASVKPSGKTCEKCGTPVVWVKRKGSKPWSTCLSPVCETRAKWGSKSEAKAKANANNS